MHDGFRLDLDLENVQYMGDMSMQARQGQDGCVILAPDM